MDQTQLRFYVQNNTLDAAAEDLARERMAAETAGNKEQTALVSNDLGVVYMLMRQNDNARRALTDAQRLFLELNDAAGQGRATGNLAQLEERAGNSEKAGAVYMLAADLLHEGRASGDEYITRRRLSRYYLTRGAAWLSLAEISKALAVKPDPTLFDKFQRWFYVLPLRLMGIS